MAYPSLHTIPWVRQQAKVAQTMESVAKFSGLPRGNVRATVIDVNDPENRGRVRVLFDAFNAIDIPQVEGSGEYSQSRNDYDYSDLISHWIDTSPAFAGRQPPGLVGKRVNIELSNSQYSYAILQDVVYDPQNLTDTSADLLKVPNNSSMTRLPIYPAGQLPDPVSFNIGCMVVEEGGPMNSDWLCVCLKRDGKHIWVRHGDLAHGHAGGNDITSQVGADGVRPGNGQVAFIWDRTVVTSHQESTKHSAFGTGFRGNPFGDYARWYPPPMGKDGDGNRIEPLPIKAAELFDQKSALNFVRESGYTKDSITGLTSTYAPEISAAVSSIPGYNVAQSLLEKGQSVLKIAEDAGKIIENPEGFAKEVALSTANQYVTDQTKAAISGSSGAKGLLSTAYSSLKNALGLVTG